MIRYELQVTVDGFPEDDYTVRGDLLDLSIHCPVIKTLIYWPDGRIDHSLLEETLHLRLRIGLTYYRLLPLGE